MRAALMLTLAATAAAMAFPAIDSDRAESPAALAGTFSSAAEGVD